MTKDDDELPQMRGKDGHWSASQEGFLSCFFVCRIFFSGDFCGWDEKGVLERERDG